MEKQMALERCCKCEKPATWMYLLFDLDVSFYCREHLDLDRSGSYQHNPQGFSRQEGEDDKLKQDYYSML